MLRLEVSAADAAHSIAIRLTRADRHVSALLTHTPDGWTLRMGRGDAEAVTRHLKPAATPWPAALRLALAVCEERLARR